MMRVWRIVPRLAALDLWHEWILSLCLMIAIAAVVAPLLILIGLKHGTIQTLRERLVDDPAYRSIHPQETQEYAPEWFTKMANDPRVAFVLPTILPASSIIQTRAARDQKNHVMDLVPSAPGDPLMQAYRVSAPQNEEVVLTAAAARKLGVNVGDSLQLRATRRRQGRMEYGPQTMKVVGILPDAAGRLARIYAPLEFVVDVERFKEGMGVAARRWPGKQPQPYPSYDGILVLSAGELDPILRNALLIESGMADIQPISSGQVEKLLGQSPTSGWQAWWMSVPRGHVGQASYKAVKNKLRGRRVVVLPVVRPLTLMLEGHSYQVVGLSLSDRAAQRLDWQAPLWGGLKRNPKLDALLRMQWPQNSTLPFSKSRIEASFDGIRKLHFPIHLEPQRLVSKQPVIPVELAAVLRTAKSRGVRFDMQTQTFVLLQGGFRGFRLYARNIDDVPDLAAELEASGIPVIAEIEAIRRIQVLDSGLSRLFWLIATLGVGGGIAVLVASLYASVQRKARELAMLRLIGFSRLDLFAFPVYEGLMIALGGLVLAFVAYAGLAAVINRVFADELGQAEKICDLPLDYAGIATMITVGIALMSALFAAWQAMRIDPANAIRAE